MVEFSLNNCGFYNKNSEEVLITVLESSIQIIDVSEIIKTNTNTSQGAVIIIYTCIYLINYSSMFLINTILHRPGRIIFKILLSLARGIGFVEYNMYYFFLLVEKNVMD